MPELDPLIQLRLSEVRTHNEAIDVWSDHHEALDGRLFVLSQPGPPSVNWPARSDLNGGGYLRSVFAHDSLWFTSNEILERMFGEKKKTDIPVDYSVGFESNAAQYLCNLVEGRMSPVVVRFQQSLRQLAERRLNWEVMPALMERAESILTGRDLDHVWRVVHASEYFAACDLRHFAATGELRPQRSPGEILAATQVSLSEWHRLLSGGEIHRIRYTHSQYHVLLLKAALLHRAKPSPQAAGSNLCDFIEFMCGTVGINLPWMLWAAVGLFEKGGAFEPLRKLTASKDDLIKNSRNIAWDVMHFVDRRQLAQPVGRNGSFLVPYTLTFDRGLAQWFDQQAQRSCLMRESDRMPQFFAEFRIQDDTLKRHENHAGLAGIKSRYFSISAHAERADRLRNGPRDLGPLVAETEALVAALH